MRTSDPASSQAKSSQVKHAYERARVGREEPETRGGEVAHTQLRRAQLILEVRVQCVHDVCATRRHGGATPQAPWQARSGTAGTVAGTEDRLRMVAHVAYAVQSEDARAATRAARGCLGVRVRVRVCAHMCGWFG
jgi:hypothetical protein